MKKKAAFILLIFALCFSLVACRADPTGSTITSTGPIPTSDETETPPESELSENETSTAPNEAQPAPKAPANSDPLTLYNQAVDKLQSFSVTASRELTGGNITLIGDISKLDIQPVYDFFRKVDEPVGNSEIRPPVLNAADYASVDIKEDDANYTVTFHLKDCTLDLNALPPSNGYLYFLTLQMIEDGTNEGLQELIGGSITVNILKDAGGNFNLSNGVYTAVIKKSDNSLVSADLTFKQEAVGKIKTSYFDFVKLSVDLFADITVKVRV